MVYPIWKINNHLKQTQEITNDSPNLVVQLILCPRAEAPRTPAIHSQ